MALANTKGMVKILKMLQWVTILKCRKAPKSNIRYGESSETTMKGIVF